MSDAAHARRQRAAAWFQRHTPTYARRWGESRAFRAAVIATAVLLPIAVVLAITIEVNQWRYDVRRHQAADAVSVFVSTTCPLSRELEHALSQAAIPYRRLDVDTDEGLWGAYVLHARGVPVTVIGDRVVHGLRTGALRAELQRAGIDTSALRFARETDAGELTRLPR